MKPHRLDAAMGWRASVAAALAVGGLLLAPSTGDRLSPIAATEPQRPDPMVRLIVESDDEHILDVGRAATSLGGRSWGSSRRSAPWWSTSRRARPTRSARCPASVR